MPSRLRLAIVIVVPLTPLITRRAHELYERPRRHAGQANQDWLEAEREIRKDEPVQ